MSEESCLNDELGIIPKPEFIGQTKDQEGRSFVFCSHSKIVVDCQTQSIGELVAPILRGITGFDLPIVLDDSTAFDLILTVTEEQLDLGDEGYFLSVSDTCIAISALNAAGIFYGCQTLIQMLTPQSQSMTTEHPGELKSAVSVPLVTIKDRPRFAYRGAMLDVVRHFFCVEDIFRFIDLMVFHKLNVLHLHLSDDQGWRLHINSWPKLTEVSGRSQVGDNNGGFYTQEAFSKIVQYADARFVKIVPEIDMPGHSNAALAAYSQLNPDGVAKRVYHGTDVGFSSFWIDSEITYQFIDDVIREISQLTNAKWFHIGGDEADATGRDDYVRFIRRVQKIVTAHGQTMVGWDETGTVQLDDPFIVQYWKHPQNAVLGVKHGAKIIASPSKYVYLDMQYNDDTPIGTDWARQIEVDEAYEFEPVSDGLVEADILGVEAPLWTETIRTFDDIEFMVFPRLCGVSEVGWSAKEGRAWSEYKSRLILHQQRLKEMNVNFYVSDKVK